MVSFYDKLREVIFRFHFRYPVYLWLVYGEMSL